MKKLIFFVYALVILGSCSGGKKTEEVDSQIDSAIVVEDTTAVVEESAVVEETVADTSEQDMNLIRAFYATTVFGGDEGYAKAHCTATMLKRMQKAYKDEYDEDGLAVWLFRSPSQDGDGPQVIKNITPKGDGWYVVDVNDMGNPCTVSVKVTDGKISDLKD